MRTVYPFTLPRGYIGPDGTVHRDGTMRLATGRDELKPLRDPFVKGPDDPRLTMLVLARVVQRIGAIEYVTLHEIEGLFAADLAFLQDFYSVVNFGDQAEYEALLLSAGRRRPDLVVPDRLGVQIPGPAGGPDPSGEPSGGSGVPELGTTTAGVPVGVAAGLPAGVASAVPAGPGGPEGGAEGGPDPVPHRPPVAQNEFVTRPGRVLAPPTRRDAILEVAAVGARA